MTSDKQAKANRRNASKSTGPKTPEGKAAVRHNAVKHGLLSKDVLLPGEDESVLQELGDALRAELQPEGFLESLQVEEIILNYWRLRRLRRVEVGIFAIERYEELIERAEGEAKSLEGSSLTDIVEENRDLSKADEQKRQEALRRAEKLRKAQQDTESVTLGRTFMRDASGANAFSKLSRYEVAIVRNISRALHELQRLQAARYAEGNVTPPAALEIDVSGVSREDT